MLSVLKWLGIALLLLVAGCGVVLVEAHWEIRSVTPALPEPADLAVVAEAAGPVRVSYLNTSRQDFMGGKMAHPSFVLEWADGRIFLIDAGMRPEVALQFGRPFEWLEGSDPAETFGAVGTQLGPASARVAGAAFTHLHHDHTDGLSTVCDAGGQGVRLFQTPDQATRQNFGTWPGVASLERVGCAERAMLPAEPLAALTGFPGLAAIAVGGHTPGSTAYVARVGGTTWFFSGDITNTLADLLEDRPKPAIYSLLIVPEATSRMALLRRWVKRMVDAPGSKLVVSHDRGALEATGMRPWSP